MTPGRPKLQNVLNTVVDRACALFHRGLEDDGRRAKASGRGADGKRASSRPAGVFVTVCGPQGLAEDLRKVVRSVDPDRRKRAGGVELFDEYVPCEVISWTWLLIRRLSLGSLAAERLRSPLWTCVYDSRPSRFLMSPCYRGFPLVLIGHPAAATVLHSRCLQQLHRLLYPFFPCF